MRKGHYMSTTALFGYRKIEGNKNRLEVDPVAAEYVRKVFNLCLEGKTSGAIALEMNAKAIPTPLVYKRINGYDRKWRNVNDTNHWTRAMVLKILRDERYIGSTVSGKTRVLKVGSNQRLRQSKSNWVVVPDTHEPIISENLFNEAQILLGLKTERPAYGAKERLFAGKIKCGTCGHAMRGRYDRVRPFFFCETTKIHKTDCTKDKVYEDELCNMVLASIRLYAEMAICADSFFVQLQDHVKGDTAKIVANITSIQTDIEKAKSAKVALYESYKEGTLSKDMYIEEKKRSDADISVLHSRMGKMNINLEALRCEETNNRFVDNFKSLGHLSELTPQLVSKLVAAIKIHDSYDIGITWNFEDDYQRVLRFC
jgi:hypothetical protein